MFKSVYYWFVDKFEDWQDHRRRIKRQNKKYRKLARPRYRLRLVWFVRQLFPLTYWTTYADAYGQGRFAIWKMWFGRVYRLTEFPTHRSRNE